MKWNKWIRETHRWLSILFTVTIIIVTIVVAAQLPASWMYYLPLPPLALLTLSGLYLFVLPYATKWRSRQRAD